MKHRKMTTFAMVNTIFIGIFLLFLIAGVMISSIGARRAMSDVEETVNTRMTYFMSEFNAEIQRMNTAVRNLYINKDVNWVSTNRGIYIDYELASALIRIEEHKTSLESISATIHSVKLYIPSVGLVFQDSKGSVGNFYKQSAESMQAYAEGIKFGKIFIEDGRVIIGYPFTTVDKQMTFMVLIDLDSQKIADDLSHALTSYENRYAFAFCGGELVLSNLPEDEREDTATYMISEIADDALGVTYSVYVVRDEILSEYRSFMLFALALTVMFLLCSVGFFLITKRLVRRPMVRLMEGFKQMEKGAFPVRIAERGSRDFDYIYSAFNEMNEKLYELIDLTYNQKILLQKSELKQLQAQINPHFLYNTLFMMNTLIRSEDNERAMLLSRALGQYYQYITRNAATDVTLREENHHARIYSDIQAARFDGRIEAEYEELPESMASLMVPRLMIQPLIENAYSYGLAEKTQGGRLRVSFRAEDGRHSIFIEDNGDQLSDEQLGRMRRAVGAADGDGGEVTGSMNIDRRIRIMFAEGSGLIFTRSAMGGLSAEIRLIPKAAPKGPSA